jgi:hypothetical protein
MAAAHPTAAASGAAQERAQTAAPRATSAVTEAHQNSLGKIVLRKRGRTANFPCYQERRAHKTSDSPRFRRRR